MQQIHDTAYPMLPAELGETELATVFTPSPAEIRFVADQYRQAPTRALILVQLKLYQRLGYCPPVSGVPTAIVHHVCSVLRIRPLLRSVLARYDRSGSKSRHQKLLRDFIGIRTTDAQTHAWLADVAAHAARIKTELPDIINVLIEELIRHRYELPPLAALTRIAAHARSQVNETIYRTIVEALGPDLIVRIDALFDNRGGRTGWDQVKREPKRPAPREIAGFLKHIEALRVLADGMPVAPEILTAPKCTQLVTEARALDVQEMRSLKPTKRYALAVLFILAQLQKALDDVAEIFIKTVRNLEHTAELRLQQYQLAHADQLEALVGQFRDVLGVLQDDTLPAEARVAKMRAALGGDPDGVLTRCNEHIAYAGNHTFPFMLRPYRNLRALLFQCLDLLSLRASSQDDALLRALDWMRSYRTSHREYLMLSDRDAANLPLGWIPDKWEKPIFPNGKSGRLMHRKYFELCVFSQIMRELKSGDIYVENSDQYDDPRVHQVSWEEFRAELPRYSELVNFPVDGKAFVQALKEELGTLADAVDSEFPANDHVEISEQGLILHRLEKDPDPPNKLLIDQAITASMPPVSILDILIETERWLDLHKLFGPLSGFEAKIDDPRKRFITTLFCYGCNLGPSQTARSVKNLSRKQVAWLNLRHVTEERLDKAIVQVINAYNRFALPKFWGSGKRVSADGTKWNLYEQNLLSEYHIRYGGYGGIGYYHVSDMYIALFSHFIPCGVHEAVYILDGLLKNASSVQPDTVHGDTQAQSGPVFGLAHLLGINLMPRIRNIKDLVFYKADRRRRYKNIDSLFRGTIDWALIERHFPDMLRVAISIKVGRMTPSTILRRLGSESRKNKLYFAFRELGRVIRTMFLLKYISNPDMRRAIHAATNKSEQFNDYAQWLMFGGEGVSAENIRHEQRKVIKYNQLVANMVILYNVQWMSRKLKELQEKGLPIDAEVLKVLSPYRKDHINRFGDYLMDLHKKVPPLDPTIDFSFKSAA